MLTGRLVSACIRGISLELTLDLILVSSHASVPGEERAYSPGIATGHSMAAAQR